MDTRLNSGFVTLPDAPQPMDTTEGEALAANLGLLSVEKLTKGPHVKKGRRR